MAADPTDTPDLNDVDDVNDAGLAARLDRIRKLRDELLTVQADSEAARELTERINREIEDVREAIKPVVTHQPKTR